MNEKAEAVSEPRVMPAVDALRVLADVRRDDEVVITHQGSSRIWPRISQHALDYHYNPSTMGGAVPFGLGLALADSSREFMIVTGDGSLLMSLGSLVSVVGAGVTNLTVCVLDNGRYEVTGGQKTPATDRPVDYCELARAVGFRSASRFDCIAGLGREMKEFLAQPGPRCVWLQVGPIEADELRSPPIPLGEQTRRLTRALSSRCDA